jgi:hypothetical protein
METHLPAIASPGSRPLKNAKYERYCRLRASAQPRIAAYREVGWQTKDDKDAYSNACALERRSQIRDRIGYLTRQAEDRIADKRARVEEHLWNVHEARLSDYFEAYETIKRDHTGQPEKNADGSLSTELRVRPKLLTDLPAELSKLIEDVTVDNRGRLIPRLYSKEKASKELRAMHNFGAKTPERDVTQLSDQELISTLAAQARELGITIDLNYSFAQQPPATKTDEQDSQVIDIESESNTPSAAAAAPRKR